LSDLFRQHLRDGEQAGIRYALAPPRKVSLGAGGIHRGGRAGSSLEFKEHREYEPGDDLRHIDWSAYARSDQLAVKLFHEEINPYLDVVIDGSRSMALEDSAKARAAVGLAAFFATVAGNAAFGHLAWVVRESCQPVANGQGHPSGWGPIELDYGGSPAESLARQLPSWKPRGIRVLLSDLLWEGDPLPLLGLFAEKATAVVVVQILADADVNPPGPGNLRLLDVETGQIRDLWLDAPARAKYQQALAQHQQNWHLACRQVGAMLTTVVAEKIGQDWRLDDLVAAEVLKVI
jgi:uncharacterized protein (DUF58 family)